MNAASRQRVADYARHFNATPVEMDRHGTLQPVDLSDIRAREEADVASRSAATIRQSLAHGSAQVTIACPSTQVESAIRKQLSENELAKVVFHTAR